MDGNAADVTALLERSRGGDDGAVERLLPLLYEELRELARRQMHSERRDHTLSATALVHEAFLQLVRQDRQDFANRSHFLAIAATAMRRVLLHHAERRRADKRGRPSDRVTLDDDLVASTDRSGDVVAIDEALRRFAAIDPAKARLVELRFFGGLTAEEAAEALARPLRSVERDWRFAKAWLKSTLESS